MRAAPHPSPHPLPAGRGWGAGGEGRQDGGGEVGRAGRRCCRRHRRRLRFSRLWFFKLSPPGEAVPASDPAGKVSPLLSPFLPLHSSRTASHSHPPRGAVRGRAGGAATSPRLGASLAPRSPLSCAPWGPSGARSRRRPRRARFLRPSAPGPAVAARGALGPRGPRCPGPEAPRLAEEAASADAGSDSDWAVPPLLPRLDPGAARSRPLRKVSSVILQKSSSRTIVPVQGECGRRQGRPRSGPPPLQFADYLGVGVMGTVRGARGATFTPHPVIRLILPRARSLASWILSKHLCGGERRLEIGLL